MSHGSLKTPIGRAKGLGSAKEGVEHWWMQRITAIALVPLTFWFVISLIAHLGDDYGAFREWLSGPFTAATLVLTLFAAFYHAALGLQVVIEDYVHHEGLKVASIVVAKFACILFGTASVLSVLKIAFGG